MFNFIKRWFFKKSKKEDVYFTNLFIGDYLPMELDSRVIYYSKKYNVCKFLCPRCSEEVVLKTGKHVDIQNKIWKIKIHRDKRVTLQNSIGSWNTCNAHYFIIKSQIHWLKDIY